jgi:hypothetical protein
MEAIRAIVVVAASAVVSASALAAAPAPERGWYGGLDVDKSRVGMGYRFGPSFTIEGSYGRLDSQRYVAPAAPWAQKIEPWPAYGMSARYDFTKRLFGRFEWDRYSPANELDAFRRGDERYQFRFGFRF